MQRLLSGLFQLSQRLLAIVLGPLQAKHPGSLGNCQNHRCPAVLPRRVGVTRVPIPFVASFSCRTRGPIRPGYPPTSDRQVDSRQKRIVALVERYLDSGDRAGATPPTQYLNTAGAASSSSKRMGWNRPQIRATCLRCAVPWRNTSFGSRSTKAEAPAHCYPNLPYAEPPPRLRQQRHILTPFGTTRHVPLENFPPDLNCYKSSGTSYVW